jgi:hypothetical protein
MTELTKQDLIDALKESGLGKGNSSSSSSAPQGGNAVSGGYVDNFAKKAGDAAEAVGPLVFGFKRLTEGSDVAGVALNGFNSAVGQLPGGLNKVGALMGDLGGAVLQQKKNLDIANATLGIGNNDIGKFVRMAGEAGVTTEQFTKVIQNSNGAIAGLGGTAQHSAENFSKLAKDVQQSNLGQQLTLAGVSAEEMANYTALSMTNEVNKNLKDTATREKAAASAAELAQELDATSKLTGQSREALAKSIAAEEKKPS